MRIPDWDDSVVRIQDLFWDHPMLVRIGVTIPNSRILWIIKSKATSVFDFDLYVMVIF